MRSPPRGAMYKLNDTPQRVGAIEGDRRTMRSTPSWKREKELSRRNYRNRIAWIGHFSSIEVNGPVRSTRYTGLALFFTSTWWDTARWSVSQRCMRWQKYLTTNDIVPAEASFPPEIATSSWIRELDPAATLWKVSVATCCLFDQSLSTTASRNPQQRVSQLLCIIQNVSDSAWCLLQTVRRSDEKHHYLRKIDAAKIAVYMWIRSLIITNMNIKNDE